MMRNKIVRTLLAIISLSFFTIWVVSLFGGYFDVMGLVMAAGPGAVAFTDVTWDNNDNMGGFASEAYLFIITDVKTAPTKSADPQDDDDLIELTGDYVMNAGKKAIMVQVPPNTVGATSDIQGEPGSHSFLQQPTFFVKSTTVHRLALARKLANAFGILIVKDPNTGLLYQFGCMDFPLILKPNVKFGTAATDRRGLEVECEVSHIVPAYVYTGTIPLDPAPAEPGSGSGV